MIAAFSFVISTTRAASLPSFSIPISLRALCDLCGSFRFHVSHKIDFPNKLSISSAAVSAVSLC